MQAVDVLYQWSDDVFTTHSVPQRGILWGVLGETTETIVVKNAKAKAIGGGGCDGQAAR